MSFELRVYFFLNKIDLISQNQVGEISKWLGLQNQNVPTIQVIYSKVEPDIVSGPFGNRNY